MAIRLTISLELAPASESAVRNLRGGHRPGNWRKRILPWRFWMRRLHSRITFGPLETRTGLSPFPSNTRARHGCAVPDEERQTQLQSICGRTGRLTYYERVAYYRTGANRSPKRFGFDVLGE